MSELGEKIKEKDIDRAVNNAMEEISYLSDIIDKFINFL